MMASRWLAGDAGQERDERTGSPASARWRSSSDEDDRMPFAEAHEQAEDALEASAPGDARASLIDRPLGQQARRAPGAARAPAAGGRAPAPPGSTIDASSRVRERVAGPGRVARTTGPYGLVVAGVGRPGSGSASTAPRSPPMRALASSRKRLTPTPTVAASEDRAGPPVGGLVERGREPGELRLAPHEPRARVPTGMAAFYGSRSRARSLRTGLRPTRPTAARLPG